MNKIFIYLTYAGAIPFILCAFYLSFNIKELPFLGSVDKILSLYGLVISTFLAGSHWGQHLHLNKGLWDRFLPISSNIITVFLWFSFIVFSFKTLLLILVISFIILLFIDYQLLKSDLITNYYFRTRFFVSVIVIISLIISGLMS